MPQNRLMETYNDEWMNLMNQKNRQLKAKKMNYELIIELILAEKKTEEIIYYSKNF